MSEISKYLLLYLMDLKYEKKKIEGNFMFSRCGAIEDFWKYHRLTL